MIHRISTGAALALAALLVAIAPACAGDTYQPGDEVDFTLPSLDGGDASLRDLRGSVIVLNFFASW